MCVGLLTVHDAHVQVSVNPQGCDNEAEDESEDDLDADMAGMRLGEEPVVRQEDPSSPEVRRFHTDNPRALEALRKGYNPDLPIPEHLTYPPPGLTREEWLIEQMCLDEGNLDHSEDQTTAEQETSARDSERRG